MLHIKWLAIIACVNIRHVIMSYVITYNYIMEGVFYLEKKKTCHMIFNVVNNMYIEHLLQ